MGSIGAGGNTVLSKATPEQLRNLQTMNAGNPAALQEIANASSTVYNKGELSASVINDLKENDFWGGRGAIIETTNVWNTNPDKMAPEDDVVDKYYSVELGPKASRDAELIRKLTRLGFEKTGERRYRRFISRKYGV